MRARRAAARHGAAALGLLAACAARDPRSPEPGAATEVVRAPLGLQLDRFVAQQVDSGFAGVVLVEKDGEVVLHRGYGWVDRERRRPARIDTPFYIASISKQFTAAAILKLQEQGRLSVTDPIETHLAGVPEDRRGITIHQLLTHTAGLAQNYAADGVVDREAAVLAVLRQPLAHPPGERFVYSNDGYNLLAVLVEVVSGQSFETYLRQQLFQPAGLTRTGCWGDAGRGAVAEVHGTLDSTVLRPNWGFRGATGLYSTAADLHRWYAALQGDGVLSAAGRRALLSPQVELRATLHAGYGWYIGPTRRGTTAVWTRGTEEMGHNAMLMGDPASGWVVAAVSNAGEWSGRIAWSRHLVEMLAEQMP
jgi:CubicO group peptidase (beta-lactamase class C family)